jgi:hypothetical protein
VSRVFLGLKMSVRNLFSTCFGCEDVLYVIDLSDFGVEIEIGELRLRLVNLKEFGERLRSWEVL